MVYQDQLETSFFAAIRAPRKFRIVFDNLRYVINFKVNIVEEQKQT